MGLTGVVLVVFIVVFAVAIKFLSPMRALLVMLAMFSVFLLGLMMLVDSLAVGKSDRLHAEQSSDVYVYIDGWGDDEATVRAILSSLVETCDSLTFYSNKRGISEDDGNIYIDTSKTNFVQFMGLDNGTFNLVHFNILQGDRAKRGEVITYYQNQSTTRITADVINISTLEHIFDSVISKRSGHRYTLDNGDGEKLMTVTIRDDEYMLDYNAQK